jgi:polysaccharide export outer membrane protein
MTKNLLLALSTGLLLVTGACETGTPASARPSSNSLEPTRTNPVYQLGSGDQLRITVFGQPDLTGEFDVDGSGVIAMPLIGEVAAQDLSVRELETLIASMLADGYIRDPRVSAEVTNYRPFYILGEVNRAGEYPFTSGLTVKNAVAAAGGYTYRANQRVVFIKALEADGEKSYDLDATIHVQPGDTIRIGERLF